MRFGEPGTATRYYDGALDELNLATAARSANWIDAQYASMTGTLISNGAVQARPAMLGVLANDTDPGGLPLTTVLVSGPSNAATFTLNADGTFNYTSVPNYNGTDTFTYRADDGIGNSNTATVTITVNSINDAPAGTNNTVTALEDTAYTFAAVDFGFTDSNDSPANALTAVKIATIPGAGSLTDNRRGGKRRSAGERGQHRRGQLEVHPGRQCQRCGLRQLHLPGARRRGHGQRRGGSGSKPQHHHRECHRGQ